MSYILWRKNYASSNDTERLPPSAWIDLQNDIASKIDGGLTDSNFSSTAAVVESKFAFDTAVGHNHDGVNSRLISGVNPTVTHNPHLRDSMTLSRIDDDTIEVSSGFVTIGDAKLTFTSATRITVSGSGNFVTGSESADQDIYVYIRNDGTTSSPSPTLKLSTEAPDLGNVDDGTAELPLRYQKYSDVFHRCLGVIRNNALSNLESGTASNFDASFYMTGFQDGAGSDITVPTIWTPSYITIAYSATPAKQNAVMDYNETTADLLGDSLLGHMGSKFAGDTYRSRFETSTTYVGGAKTITAQSAGTAGSFTIHAPALVNYVYYSAYYAGSRGA